MCGSTPQYFMWECIDNLPPPKDWLQVFALSAREGKTRVTHTQEVPAYKREYLLDVNTPVFVYKVFVVDDGTDSTMMLAEEY